MTEGSNIHSSSTMNENDENQMIVDNVDNKTKKKKNMESTVLKNHQKQEDEEVEEVEEVGVAEEEDEEEEKDSTCRMTSPPPPTVSMSTTSKTKAITYSPELSKIYYQRLFPFSLLYAWLNYHPKYDPTLFSSSGSSRSSSGSSSSSSTPATKLFSNREFSFTIDIDGGEEVYIRYQSFASLEEFSSMVVKRNPTKIDIGAVFSIPPKDLKGVQQSHSGGGGNNTCPYQRELVFDIDLTDYDDIRACGCQNAEICSTCWKFMSCAIRVMHIGLQEDFGFKHIAWFYSGRRGVHCWICDESARTLSNDGRNAVASYFELPLMNDRNQQTNTGNVTPKPIHPMIQRSFDLLEPMFIDYILPGHGLLTSPEQYTKILQLLPDSATPVREVLLKKWNQEQEDEHDERYRSTPEEKWEQLKRHLQIFISKESSSSSSSEHTKKAQKKFSSKDQLLLEQWPIQLVLKYTYPRLDINVSKTMNHLLKSPFCVHPKTGRVCVPINMEYKEQFDPFQVPTVSQLMDELDAAMSDTKTKTKTKTSQHPHHRQLWQQTSLKQYFVPFQKQFLEPMLKELHQKDKQSREQQAAIMGDF